jgi:uncharacterized membrane protein
MKPTIRAPFVSEKTGFRPGSQLEWGLLLLILLTGIFLRVYQLGTDTLWHDEIGVVDVVSQPGLIAVIRATGWHAMAMPLDYVVRWVFAQVSTSDGFLRLPSAIFGILTLPVAFLLFKRLANARVALLAVFLLATSPLHVERSQELRFYAAMILFYLLSTHLLLIAVDTGRLPDWLRFTAVAAVGLLFHIYVLFALVNGAVFLLYHAFQKRLNIGSLRYYVASSTALLVVFLLAYKILIDQGRYAHRLDDFGPLLGGIASGMGWLVPYVLPGSLLSLLGLVFLALTVTAIVLPFRKGDLSPQVVLGMSVLIQVGLILLSDRLFHYFFAARQLAFLTPFTYYFAALGLFCLYDRVKNHAVWRAALLWKGAAWFLVLVMLAANLFGVQAYYQQENEDYLAILQNISAYWTADAAAYVHPYYEVNSYYFYCRRHADVLPICENMHSIVNFSDLPLDHRENTPLFLLIHQPLSDEQQQALRDHQFERDLDRFGGRVWLNSPALTLLEVQD